MVQTKLGQTGLSEEKVFEILEGDMYLGTILGEKYVCDKGVGGDFFTVYRNGKMVAFFLYPLVVKERKWQV